MEGICGKMNFYFSMHFDWQCSSLEQLNIAAAQQHQTKHQPGTSTPKASSSASSGPSQTNLGASLSLLQQEQEQCNRERYRAKTRNGVKHKRYTTCINITFHIMFLTLYLQLFDSNRFWIEVWIHLE